MEVRLTTALCREEHRYEARFLSPDTMCIAIAPLPGAGYDPPARGVSGIEHDE